MLFDSSCDFCPIEIGTPEMAFVGAECGGWRPTQVLRIIDASLNRFERTARFGQLDAGLHRVEAHKLHHLCREFLSFLRAIADSHVVHEISKSHDPQSDPACGIRRFSKLRYCRDISIGAHNVVEEPCRQDNALLELIPIHGSAGAAKLCQVYGAQTAIFVRPKPLLSAGIRGFQFVEMGYGIISVCGVEE